MHFFDQYALQK